MLREADHALWIAISKCGDHIRSLLEADYEVIVVNSAAPFKVN